MIQEHLVALLSPLVSGGVFPNIAPASVAAPYIVYSVVASSPESVMSGPPSIKNTRFQVDCYSPSYLAVQTLATQVEDAMATWVIQNVPLMKMDRIDSDANLHRVILDFSVWHYS